MVNSFDATEVVDGLCEKLQQAQFEDYDDEDQLLQDVGELVTEYIEGQLGDFAHVWVEGRDRGRIKPVWAYGDDFSPDIAVEVGDLPAVAIDVRLGTRADGVADPIGAAVGRALIFSVQYSYVIVFVLDRSNSDARKHWFDGEIETRLWEDHRISLIVRQ